ncbi:hypothetical protein [Limnohabitans radicicola]|uniref:Uncharacterized protein n=1 Tax=Limnohabitans radicicola TaxID=2771427 RepID=A0A927FF95_9BURK|nr:hypothetical protein [Limnohabitans radicicola]MBD8048973.1 hypothetical protein [Limnohabitans radicicola]
MSMRSQLLINEVIAQQPPLSSREVSRFSATEIREAIAKLVVDDRMELAQALGDAGLSLYPNHPEILAIATLLAEIRHDWIAADSLIEQLVHIQGDATPVVTWQHWVRILRSQCEHQKALKVVKAALTLYPDQPVLLQERLSLTELLGDTNTMPFSARVQ